MAWRARCYLKYDLAYTKGLAVWAVGDPPNENPNRSLDHPQLGLFLPALDMAIFGADEKGIRIGGIIKAVLSLLIFLKIVRGLLDDKTALLAGIFFAILPITGYFWHQAWMTPLNFVSLLTIWFYLAILGYLKDQPEPKPWHKWGLAISLFLVLQLRWEGLFYAAAIAVHYIFRCIRRKQFPEKPLLAILIFAPLTSLIINFSIMAAGHGWDLKKIWSLYQWRAAKGEMPWFQWGPWFAKMWEFALTNFTLPVLITAIIYMTLGQLYIFALRTHKKQTAPNQRRFPQFCLFLMPAIFQLFLLRGALWRHQFWEGPLVPVIAIALALAIMLLADIIGKISPHAAKIAIVLCVGIIFVSCTMGTNLYYYIRWRSPNEVKMFKDLNQKIPPDKALLSFDDFIVNQHPVKGPHLRPEVAWYLDRIITRARTFDQVQSYAKTGNYPYYLIPYQKTLMQLIKRLNLRYKYELIAGQNGETDKKGRFLRAGMPSYVIFDLYSSASGG